MDRIDFNYMRRLSESEVTDFIEGFGGDRAHIESCLSFDGKKWKLKSDIVADIEYNKKFVSSSLSDLSNDVVRQYETNVHSEICKQLAASEHKSVKINRESIKCSINKYSDLVSIRCVIFYGENTLNMEVAYALKNTLDFTDTMSNVEHSKITDFLLCNEDSLYYDKEYTNNRILINSLRLIRDKVDHLNLDNLSPNPVEMIKFFSS